MSPRTPSILRRAGRLAWEWIRSGFIALILFLGVRTFLMEAFKIPTASMEGTILVGDFLLVNKAVYGAEIPGTDLRLPALAPVERFDVVVFEPPHETHRHYVKRLVGIPGDTLAMRDKTLLVNGVAVDEPYVEHRDPHGDAYHPRMRWQVDHLAPGIDPDDYRPSRDNWGPLVVPEGSLFVLGDNRDNSEDSRYWGFVDRASVKGQPWRVYYSFRGAAERKAAWLREVRWNRIGERIE